MSILIEQYSERAGAVFGDTKPHKEKLKDAGCKYNSSLKRGDNKEPGWVFALKNKQKIEELVNGINGMNRVNGVDNEEKQRKETEENKETNTEVVNENNKDTEKETVKKFKVGDIVVGRLIRKAGCSSHDIFGKITKITPTGKYRIAFLGSISDEESKENYSNQHSSMRVAKPDIDYLTGKSVLAADEEEDRDDIWSKEHVWELYDRNKTYGSYYDNGD